MWASSLGQAGTPRTHRFGRICQPLQAVVEAPHGPLEHLAGSGQTVSTVQARPRPLSQDMPLCKQSPVTAWELSRSLHWLAAYVSTSNNSARPDWRLDVMCPRIPLQTWLTEASTALLRNTPVTKSFGGGFFF